MAKTVEERLEIMENRIGYLIELMEGLDATMKMTLQNHSEEKLLTVQDVAEMTGMDINLIYSKCKKGEMPYFRVGKPIRFKKTEILTWIKNRKKDETGSVDELVHKYLQKYQLRS